MSAFDAPIFQAAIAKEAVQGEPQGVALTLEEAAILGKRAGQDLRDYFKSLAWGAAAVASSCLIPLGTSLMYPNLPAKEIVTIFNPVILIGMMCAGAAFFSKLINNRNERREACVILKAGVRPIEGGGGLKPLSEEEAATRPAVALIPLAQRGRWPQKNI